MARERLAEQLAQAALRAWFNDPVGFKNMAQDASRRAAVRAVLHVLDNAHARTLDLEDDEVDQGEPGA